jgi:hypothetical protein
MSNASPKTGFDSVRPRVVRGRKFKDAVAEIFAANAQLLALERNHSHRIAKMEKDRKPRPKR